MDLLDALWKGGPMIASEVQGRFEARGIALAYNTVQTMLVRLFEKGVLRRTLDGRAYRYEVIPEQRSVAQRAVKTITSRFFGGSAAKLAVHLVESDLTAEDLDRLQKLIDVERRKRKVR